MNAQDRIQRHERQRQALLKACERRKRTRIQQRQQAKTTTPAWKKALEQRQIHTAEPQQTPRCYPSQEGWKRNTINLEGMRFGRWIAVRRDQQAPQGPAQEARWLCVCDCGNTKSVKGRRLRDGSSKSCGCLNRELSALRLRKRAHSIHGRNVTDSHS